MAKLNDKIKNCIKIYMYKNQYNNFYNAFLKAK